MSLKIRRLLYLSFILAFLIITPLLILYSLGYTWQGGFKLQKSGILIIKTEPRGAYISLNNKKIQNFWNHFFFNEQNYTKTPAQIKNLKAGEYNIKLELPGYWPWSKKLTILSGQTTFAEDIFLFKKDQASLITSMFDKNISLSPDKNFFVINASSSLKIINLNNNETRIFKTTSANNTNHKIYWSPNKKQIMYNLHIYSLNNNIPPLNLKKLIGDKLDNFTWSNSQDKLIYYTFQNKLYSFDLNTNNNEALLDSIQINTLIKKNKSLYFVKQDKNKSTLVAWQADYGEQTKLQLPYSDYEFINPEHKLLNLLDKQNKILYLIDTESKLKILQQHLSKIEKTQWVTANKLLYTTGFEIWLFDLNSLNKKLLTRVSNHINAIDWHPSNNYILFSNSSSINILELDNREKHSITKIITKPLINNMFLDKSGEIVYFISTENNTKKLYKLFIQ